MITLSTFLQPVEVWNNYLVMRSILPIFRSRIWQIADIFVSHSILPQISFSSNVIRINPKEIFIKIVPVISAHLASSDRKDGSFEFQRGIFLCFLSIFSQFIANELFGICVHVSG